jgi:hypothetical protein
VHFTHFSVRVDFSEMANRKVADIIKDHDIHAPELLLLLLSPS